MRPLQQPVAHSPQSGIKLKDIPYYQAGGVVLLKIASNKVDASGVKGEKVKFKALVLDPQTKNTLGKISLSYYLESEDQTDLSFFLGFRCQNGELYCPDVKVSDYGDQYLTEINGREVHAIVEYKGEGSYNGYSFSKHNLICFCDNRGFDAYAVNSNSAQPSPHVVEILQKIKNEGMAQQAVQQMHQNAPQPQQQQYYGAQPQQQYYGAPPQQQQGQVTQQQGNNNDPLPF